MPSKGNKCCCGCPGRCLTHGESHTPCFADVPIVWFVAAHPSSRVTTWCCDPGTLPAGLVLDTGCVWTGHNGACNDFGLTVTWVLEVVSATDVTLTMTDSDGDTLVWVLDTGTIWVMLCPNVLIYDASLSSPPTDGCDWADKVCLTPENSCCDDTDSRPIAPMPDVLTATYAHCCPPNSSDQMTLTWNPVTGRYEGSATVCGGTLTLTLRCICKGSLVQGCGDVGPNQCYAMIANFVGCSAADFNSGDIGWENCACEPFEADFIMGEPWIPCCAVEDVITLIVTVVE